MRDLHKNKKWAFIDGALSGILVTYFVMKTKRELEKMIEHENSCAVLNDAK